MVAGDFNAHIGSSSELGSSTNTQGQLLNQLMDRYPLYPVTLSSLMKGPRYTFFRDNTESLIDLVLLSAAHASLMEESEVLHYHPLNTSDHFPVKIDAKRSTEGNDAFPLPRKINWKKAIEDLIREYAKKVEDIVRPLIGIPYLSMKALEVETCKYSSFENNSSSLVLSSPYWSEEVQKDEVIYQG